jgi:transposase
VRDDRPFAGKAAPAAVLYYSPTREGTLPQRQLAHYTSIIQVDAYSGYNALFADGRKPGPIVEAACWAHGRCKLYELARLARMPIAIEAVCRIDELFAIERDINGLPPEHVSPSGARDRNRSSRISNAGSEPSGASCPRRTRWPTMDYSLKR